MSDAFSSSTARCIACLGVTTDGVTRRQPLVVKPTRRPYPLLEFLGISPLLRSDIAHDSPGIPLTLCITLRDTRGFPVQQAAVYIWHYDSRGWSIELDGDELDTVTRMRGVQISDGRGRVVFQTIYPGRYRDHSVPVYLQIYFNDGQHVNGRANLCILLPEFGSGAFQEVAWASPVPGNPARPCFNASADATVMTLTRLVMDPDLHRLRGDADVEIAWPCPPG